MTSIGAETILYVFDTGPYTSSAGLEALDAALIGASFEQDISLLFIHDGVFQLKREQDVGLSQLKQYTKTFNALGDFDIESVYVHEMSLLARGLTQDDLIIDTKLVDSDELKLIIGAQYRVFTF